MFFVKRRWSCSEDLVGMVLLSTSLADASSTKQMIALSFLCTLRV